MKIIFAGTPVFAEVALAALLTSAHHVMAVYTQPDRPAGRGLKLTASPVKKLAQTYQLPLHQPLSLRAESEQAQIQQYQADVMVVAAYSLLLPAAVLSIPRFGCINIHPSLLPRWRGAAPIQRTIFAGDTETGVSIMQMDQGLDTGPVWLQCHYTLQPHETAQTLHDHLAPLGANALLQTLDLLAAGQVKPQAQQEDLATYAHKISKEEALIDWQLPARQLDCLIRAFNPWPVAYTSWQNQSLRIWQAEMLTTTSSAPPRTILAFTRAGLDIASGQGVLRLLQVQLPGSKPVTIADFFNAKQHELAVGQLLI